MSNLKTMIKKKKGEKEGSENWHRLKEEGKMKIKQKNKRKKMKI